MLFEVLQYLRNWFTAQKYFGEFSIVNGRLDLVASGIQATENQYVRIIGSALNDGVYLISAMALSDEIFDGAVWVLSIPRPLLELVSEIEAWQTKNAAAVTSPFQSESFENYSYTRATDANGNAVSWQTAFATRLAPWRKA